VVFSAIDDTTTADADNFKKGIALAHPAVT